MINRFNPHYTKVTNTIDGREHKRIRLQNTLDDLQRFITAGVVSDSDPRVIAALEHCRRGHEMAMAVEVAKIRQESGNG
jgi:hypothetical protein